MYSRNNTMKYWGNFQYDPDHPNRRFKEIFGGGGKKVKAPAPISPAPTPTELDEDVRQRDRDKRRQKIAASGRAGTILTSGQSLSSGKATGTATGTATVLGRSI